MRIAGHIDHPKMKVTIFQMENKFAVKFEDGLLEQTYKFRAGGDIQSVQSIKQLVDATFLKMVSQQMTSMQQARQLALENLASLSEDDEFEDIL